ncbi:MAG TPA: hypothetical protein ENK63_01845 [Rhodobacterales bacterium]|nr:hypothetical protein [Rhodobacterales bacterium]
MGFMLFLPMLFAAFAIGGLFDGSGPEPEPDRPDPPDPQPEPEPEPEPDPASTHPGTQLELSHSSAPQLTGTEGNDTLISADETGQTPTEDVFLGAGNDIADVSLENSSTSSGHVSVAVMGEEGDDTLRATAPVTLDGGAGDDILLAGDFATLRGGDGDDVLIHDGTLYGSSTTSTMDGGDGDDTLIANGFVGNEEPIFGGALMTGGDGSDTFQYDLTLVDGTPPFTDPDADTIHNSAPPIMDFDPDQDKLVIDLDRDEDSADREVTAFELDEYDYTSGGTRVVGTDVIISIEAGSDGTPVELRIGLPGAVGLTEDHFDLRGFELEPVSA